MRRAISVLRSKGVDVSEKEEMDASLAILMHDMGHGPFSHALESSILTSMNHERISLELMKRIHTEGRVSLEGAIDVFTGRHPKAYLHQLVSSQLDVDRLDYLTRDSFYSGVAEGMIGLDRIIQMLIVKDDHLIVESKGVHSVEKFLISRRLMYWQVYLHKTVIAAEKLLTHILRRAAFILKQGQDMEMSAPLKYLLLHGSDRENMDQLLDMFVQVDDADVIYSIRQWANSEDRVLSDLSRRLMNRHLPKLELRQEPVSDEEFEKVAARFVALGFPEKDIDYYIYRGVVENKGYNSEEVIGVLNKDGSVDNIYQISDMLSAKAFSEITKKYFLCVPRLD